MAWEVVRVRSSGQVIEGEFTSTDSDISVRMTRPFAGLSTGRHIAYFARGHRSFAGDEGRRCAKALLEELHELGRYLAEHMDTLRSVWTRMRPDIAPTEELEESFREVRRQLRAQLRERAIDHRSYQQMLVQERKRRDEQLQIWWIATDRFFESHFPRVVPLDVRKQVLEILTKGTL
jgi:hypothetical protein